MPLQVSAASMEDVQEQYSPRGKQGQLPLTLSEERQAQQKQALARPSFFQKVVRGAKTVKQRINTYQRPGGRERDYSHLGFEQQRPQRLSRGQPLRRVPALQRIEHNPMSDLLGSNQPQAIRQVQRKRFVKRTEFVPLKGSKKGRFVKRTSYKQIRSRPQQQRQSNPLAYDPSRDIFGGNKKKKGKEYNPMNDLIRGY